MSFLFSLLAVLDVQIFPRVGAAGSGIDYNASPPNLTTLFNNTLFYTWRPKAHVLPPSGNIGDPCMHYTDPDMGHFHVGYLHNGAAGATTDDLVTYVDVAEDSTFIRPGGINDPLAVFDGSVIPVGINGTPTLLYTSVSYLPIQWTIPYKKGSETQSLAIARDGGANFTKLNQGPVIAGPPFPITNVTGFRDPFVFKDHKLDALLGDEGSDAWYNIISGGVQGEGPSLFVYRQTDPEFRDWAYLGDWWHEPASSSWGDGTWAGRWGFNFEVGTHLTLDEEGYNPEGATFVTLGAEWSEAPIVPQVSDYREMLRAAGNTTLSSNGSLAFVPSMAGNIDWCMFAYAAAGKIVPASSQASRKSGAPDRFITYLWLTNDDFGTSNFPTVQQGWSSSLTTPRELARGTIANVVDNELVHEKASWRISARDETSGTVTLATLKQTIVREALASYQYNVARKFTEPERTLSPSNVQNTSMAFAQSPISNFYLLEASIAFPRSARNSSVSAGFSLLSSKHEGTRINYRPSTEELTIDRSNSSAAAATTPGISTTNEVGKWRLFDIQNPAGDGSSEMETLDLMVLVDNSIVEVYANDRFVMSTWVWSWFEESRGLGFLVEGTGQDEVRFGNVTVWEGLVDVWPERMI